MGLTRRELLERTAVAGLAAPLVHSNTAPTIVQPLRVLTIGIEWPAEMQRQAELDLGFPIVLETVTSSHEVDIVLKGGRSFDVFGGYSYQAMRVWFAGHLRPVDTRRIAAWRDLYPLFTQGRMAPGCRFGLGDAPFRSTFLRARTHGLPTSTAGPTRSDAIVQWIDERTGKPYRGAPMPRYVVGVPAHFAAESLGYLPDVIRKAPRHVAWADLLNARWKGRVAVQNDPAVALIDLGRAAEAVGLMTFKNVAEMTVDEVDLLTRVLTVYRKQGQFQGTWSSFNDVVNLLASRDVALSPVWPSAAARVAAEGVRIGYAVPSQGYRGSCSSIGISARVPAGPRLNACYAYLNWLHQGFFGAEMMRQGYYVANGKRLPQWIQRFGSSLLGDPFNVAEYRYWYEGRPAPWPLTGVKGTHTIKRGSRREGGSIVERMCRTTAWSSYFHAAGYQARRFRDFVGA